MVAARMRPLHRSRPAQIGLAIVVVALGALGFVPLFDGPGYESSLGAGIVLQPFLVTLRQATKKPPTRWTVDDAHQEVSAS